MIRGKMNVLLDSAWGSSGKGKVASFLARRYGITDASSCNMPNAGHTVEDKGERTVYKVLPSASHFGATSWIGPGAVISEEQLDREIRFNKCGKVYIHERAGVLQEKHAEQERATLSKISSTMQGSGACLTEKLMRQGKLWGDVRGGFPGQSFRDEYREAVRGGMALHEIAQGWGLSIDHGTHYPHCTSRNCGVGRAIDDMAVPHTLVGDVYLVVRTYPIRVGNTSDGHSGGWLDDQVELTWDEIERRTGLTGLAARELTTVTKRVRRVASFSHQLLADCAAANGATRLFVTFAEYLDKAAYKVTKWENLPIVVREFCADIEGTANCPVMGVSTGPDVDDVALAPYYGGW